MSKIELLLSILLPILVITIFILGGFFTRKYFFANESTNKGVKLFNLDTYTRKIYPLNSPIKQKFIVKRLKPGTWVKLKSFAGQLSNEGEVKKKFRDAIAYLDKHNNSYSFDFESNVVHVSKRTIYKFKILISPKEDDSNFILRIEWHPISKTKKKINNVQYVDKEFVINANFEAKGFVAFNLNHDIRDASTKLINIFNQISNKELIYFKNNDVLIVAFMGNSVKVVNKKLNKFVNKVKGPGIRKGAKSFFKGSGYITLKKVDSNKHMLQAMRALDFFIILSINEKTSFISNQNKSYDAEEYKKYATGSKMFRSALRSGDIKTEFLPVRTKQSKKEVISFAYPTINGLNDNMMNRLLTNRNNQIDLIDAHAKNVAIKKTISKPVLVDIKSDWLINNYLKIKFQKAIYVIDVKQGTKYKELKEIIKIMREKGFYFAIRVKYFSELITTLIKQTSPQFIVVDKLVWIDNGVIDSTSYINLLSIRQIADAEKIKVIYEDPSELIDEKMANSIGMKFFYRSQKV